MALMPLSSQFPGMAGLQNLLRGHTTPELLPTNANGKPPPVAVPNGRARPPSGGDVLDLGGGGGGLAVDGSGIYQLQASHLNLSAQSLSISMGSGAPGGGRGALGVLNGMLGASPAGGGGAMSQLRETLEGLGLSDAEVRDLMMLAALLEKLDPEAFEKFVKGMESLAGGISAPGTAPAAPAAPTGAGQFSLNYVSVSISVTEVEASVVREGGGEVTQVSARHFEVRFERLEISMSGGGMQEGDPVVLDIAGDGLDLRETSEGVLFDLTGSGQAVRTAFVQGDDALLFYDANMNGLLDGGGELVGNRVDGQNGLEELAAMDENGDGKVSAADSAWDFLRLFQDRNGDGQASPLEVALLEDLGLSDLSALWERDEGSDGEGLRRAGSSSFTREDGTQGLMLDYYFGYRPA